MPNIKHRIQKPDTPKPGQQIFTPKTRNADLGPRFFWKHSKPQTSIQSATIPNNLWLLVELDQSAVKT
ncbi:hypothetical protein Hanom_Chr10g00963341 [Helianthus anomalus]